MARICLFLILATHGNLALAADPITAGEPVMSKDENHYSRRFSRGKDVILVEVRAQSFQRTKHRLKIDDSGGVREVDGRRALGTDAGPPDSLKSEIVSVKVSWNGTQRGIAKRFYADCFNTSAIPDRVLVSDDFQTVMVTMYGGDGGGAYGVTWTVSQEGVVHRFIADGADLN
jgi:hypothetical protein